MTETAERSPQWGKWGNAEVRDSMVTMEEVYEQDTRPIPPELREHPVDENVPLDPIPAEVFTSKEYARSEFDGLWLHVWQMACREREVANPGDYCEYRVGDQSVVVVRGNDGRLRAFQNACLHRGTKLAVDRGSAADGLKCSFHGWTWNTDGSLGRIPCRWDFPHITDEEKFRLPELLCDTWNGFVFVNFDRHAEPLADFIGPTLLRHSAEWWRLDKKFKALHIGMVVPCNWKVALEAFLEVYHIFKTHPQMTTWGSDANGDYDQIDKLHGRMRAAVGVPSPHVGDIDDEEIIESFLHQQVSAEFKGGEDAGLPAVGNGTTARMVLADLNRQTLNGMTGVDYSKHSDAEMLDAIQYYVFPNLIPWAGAFPLTYRVTPWGTDPDYSLFETILLGSVPEGQELPPEAPLRILEPGQKWSDVPEMGGFGPIADQDTENLEKLQLGLKQRNLTHVHFSDYHERNIRRLHANIAGYIERYASKKQ